MPNQPTSAHTSHRVSDQVSSQASATTQNLQPLIAHVLYRFDVGGLENGVVNLLNHPALAPFRHAVIALTDVTDFKQRVKNPNVTFHALHKQPGHGFKSYPPMLRLLRSLRPQILHSRNLSALEFAPAGLLAGVPIRIHGEHGRDVDDLDGTRKSYQWLRRLYGTSVHRFIALSKDLESYLLNPVGIAPRKVVQIYNGVDCQRYSPIAPADKMALRKQLLPWTENDTHTNFVIGCVGRLEQVKHHRYLLEAFAKLARRPDCSTARLLIIGDGSQREALMAQATSHQLQDKIRFVGNRADIPDLMRCMDVFALPSQAEGISNTILEAMASGLPVVATAVGGNVELVNSTTGRLVSLAGVDSAEQFAKQLALYVTDPRLLEQHGAVARLRVLQQFSLDSMAEAYATLYQQLLQQRSL